MTASATPYEPQPGTIPAKVIEYFKAQPKGHKATTDVVLQAIGQTHITNIRTYMLRAIGAGLIHCERLVGHASLTWSLGTGQPIAQPDAELQADQDDYSDLAGPPPTPNLAAASVFTLANASAHAFGATQTDDVQPAGHSVSHAADKTPPLAKERSKARGQLPTAAVKAVDSSAEFLCALFSDGQLLIKSGGKETVLPLKDTRQLMRYLDCISIDEHIAGAEAK